jgi:hypothetical protein
MRWAGAIHYRSGLTASMNKASRIIAISNATRNAILEHAPWHEPKIRVVYNGVDLKRVVPIDKTEAGRTLEPLIDVELRFVLTVGQGSPYKNHLNAVRGFLQAFRDRLEYRMILVRRCSAGDGALDRLLRTAQARAQVIILPYVSPEVLNALYNRARRVRVAAGGGHGGRRAARNLQRQLDAGSRRTGRPPGESRQRRSHRRRALGPRQGRGAAGKARFGEAPAARALRLGRVRAGHPRGVPRSRTGSRAAGAVGPGEPEGESCCRFKARPVASSDAKVLAFLSRHL